MASTPSGKVTASPGGLVLTYLDTGSYGTVSSRILTVYNANGQTVYGPFNMGSNLSQTVDITADSWLQFVCVVTDNVSGSPWTATVNYLAEGIYQAAFLNRIVSLNCGCQPGQFCTMFKAQLNEQAAEWFSIPGLGIQATSSIQSANVYINIQNPLVAY